jgi:hypothetical protein
MCFVFVSKQRATFTLYNKKLIASCNRNEKCLQRGANWVFNSLRFMFKGLTTNETGEIQQQNDSGLESSVKLT